MKYISKIAVACLMTGIISVSCDDKQIDRIVLEVPEPPEKSLGVNDYNDLKSYIDRNASPQFILGTGVLQADLLQKETMYLLTNLNFDEITVKDIMFHSSIVNDEGAMDFGNVQTVVETAHQAGLSVFGHALVTHNELNTAYLKALIANTTEEIIIPPPSDVEWQEGTTVLFDFELNSIGDTNPMSNANGVATVVNDPKGESGKVLHINGNTGTVDPVIGGGANQSFPEFSVTLPEGRKLGDYVSLTLDMHINNSRGIFGQGMMLHINGKEATYGNVASFGNPDNNWGRGLTVLSLSNLNLTDAEKMLTQFTLRVGTRSGDANYYIDNIKMTYQFATGKTSIADFESKNVGDANPMSNANGVATVVNDPKGESGKVLHINGSAGTIDPVIGGGANQSFPQFTVTLPEGRKLGDYVSLTLDMHINNSRGIFGQGMMLHINGKEATYGNVASFGNPDNNWGRGLTVLPLSNLNLTDAEKMLTQFTLRVGTRSGDANYYIDNIAMTWEIGSSPTYSVQIVEKTPAEKDAILTDALELYIQGMMQACDGKVKSWDIVSDPMDDDNPSELKGDPTGTDFYWQDYLGREYVRKAVRLARKHGGNDLKLFVNDYGLEANADKCKGLTDMVKFWESDGITKIDGIGVRMHMIYSLNPATQKVYEDEVTIMFNSLKESGKLIRISALDMQITDAEGAAMNTANVSVEQQKAMSKYYNFILLKYFEIIQSSQRAGITHWNSLESISYIGLWYGNFDRKYTYIGFADGLAGKETSTE